MRKRWIKGRGASRPQRFGRVWLGSSDGAMDGAIDGEKVGGPGSVGCCMSWRGIEEQVM